MWFKKLKKKKLQSVLIMALLFLSSLIFASSLSMMTSINGYVKQYYAKDKIYDVVMVNANETSNNAVKKWCRSNPEVLDVKTLETYTSGNDIYHNGQNLKFSMYDITGLEDINKVPFGLNKVKGLDKGIAPREGEVWITQLLADNFKLNLGDSLTFKIKDKEVSLKISGLVNDSTQPSSTSSQIILYTNKNSIKEFASFMKAPLVFIDVKNGVKVSELEKSLAAAVTTGGYTLDKSVLIQVATMTSSMIGGICTLASLLVFIVSILLIRFILWNNILKEYKSIGIYKAIGFSKGEILKIYIVGYALTTFVGSVLGAFCSIPILNYTAAKILKYIGDFSGVSINYSVIFATIFIFSALVILNLYFVIRRTNKISPVEALRTGVTSSKKKLTKSLIKNTTAPLALGINDIFKYKKNSAYIALTLTLGFTLVLLFGNMNMSISRMKENTDIWFGLPKSNVTISASLVNYGENLKGALKFVEKDKRVKNYENGALSYIGVNLDTAKYHLKATMYNIFVMNSYKEALGFTKIAGHNPNNPNEVAVSINILRDGGLSIGDYIELSMNNKKSEYLITGSYNSLMSNGYGVRMLSSAIQKANPSFLGSEIFVNLKEKSQIKSFEKDITKNFGKLEADGIHPLLKYTIESIPGTLLPMTYLLLVVFMAFSGITILNIILMSIRDSRRSFGIMKALGFKARAIQNRYLYRVLILTLFSTIIALGINLTIAKPMIAAAISNLNVLIIDPKTMVIILIAMIGLIVGITLVSCNIIKNTKPSELIEE